MKKRDFIIAYDVIIVLVIFGLVSLIYFSQTFSYQVPILPTLQKEITFEMAYCLSDVCQVVCDKDGGNCHRILNKEECKSIDVVTEYTQVWGYDGIPDCEWVESADNLSACQPNKC